MTMLCSLPIMIKSLLSDLHHEQHVSTLSVVKALVTILVVQFILVIVFIILIIRGHACQFKLMRVCYHSVSNPSAS